MQLILFIQICLSSLLYKDSDSVVCVSVHAHVKFQKRVFLGRWLTPTLSLTFTQVSQLEMNKRWGWGVGGRVSGWREAHKPKLKTKVWLLLLNQVKRDYFT